MPNIKLSIRSKLLEIPLGDWPAIFSKYVLLDDKQEFENIQDTTDRGGKYNKIYHLSVAEMKDFKEAVLELPGELLEKIISRSKLEGTTPGILMNYYLEREIYTPGLANL